MSLTSERGSPALSGVAVTDTVQPSIIIGAVIPALCTLMPDLWTFCPEAETVRFCVFIFPSEYLIVRGRGKGSV